MILKKLGIYGWKEELENILFASLLTGDPLLMVGAHGTCKTGLAVKIASAMDVKFHPYDASKALFEDVLGYPNIQELQKGKVEYLPSKVTIWDKQFILIDELNRALLEMQNKWLEVIRSRRIMGFNTDVKWVWSAMNPMSYAGTQSIDEALIGRFSWFVCVPDVLSMNEKDRIKVTEEINGDDAPSLDVWLKEDMKTVSEEQVHKAGKDINKIMTKAAGIFLNLKDDMSNMSEFLARFACLIDKETQGKLKLDGRRLGFIYRNILSKRSIEVAKNLLFNKKIADFKDSAKEAVLSSLPAGISKDGLNSEELQKNVEIVFDVLASYFEDKGNMSKVNKIYELFTTNNVIRKAEILIKERLGDFVHTKAWNDIVHNDTDPGKVKLVSMVALQVESKHPGTIPKEMIDSLGSNLNYYEMTASSIKKFEGESINIVPDIEKYMKGLGEVESIIAIDKLRFYMETKGDHFSVLDFEKMKVEVAEDVTTFNNITSEVR